MATKFTYVSLANLTQYDGLIKTYIGDKVSDGVKSSIKAIALKGSALKFYTVENPTDTTSAAFSVDLPETDLTQIKTDIATNTAAITKLNGSDTTDGSVAKAVKTAKDALQTEIGTLDDLKTTAKSDLVSAVNENKDAIDSLKDADAVTIDTATTTTGMLKSYTVKQGTKTVGTIDIPKDMVVKSGTVETNPAGQTAGTYIVLTLANTDEDKVYINVGTLVDIYTAEGSAAQVQLAINSTTREISATIVAGSVTATELAANAVTTAKIADGNVTKAKLSTELQASIDKADTAIQEANLTDLKADVAANKASLAEGGATSIAIKAAKSAADAAQSDVDALEARVDALEAVEYEAATTAEISALFPTA